MQRLQTVFLLFACLFVWDTEAQYGYYSPYYGGDYGGYGGYGSYYPSYSTYSYYPSYGYSNYGYNGYGYNNYGGYGGYGFCGIRCRRFQRRLMWAQMLNNGMYG